MVDSSVGLSQALESTVYPILCIIHTFRRVVASYYMYMMRYDSVLFCVFEETGKFKWFYSPRKTSHKSALGIENGGNIVKIFPVVPIVLRGVETLYVVEGPIVLRRVETLYVEDGPIVLRTGETLYVVDGPIVLRSVETLYVEDDPILLRSVDILYATDPIADKDGIVVFEEMDCTTLIVAISVATGISFVPGTFVPIMLPSVDTLCVEGPIVDKHWVEVDDEIVSTGLIVKNSLSIGISFV